MIEKAYLNSGSAQKGNLGHPGRNPKFTAAEAHSGRIVTVDT